ncbi:hypothetical protein [Shimia aestuarii]|uniref:hypothetical protein n=1 Tax=Shimia aestuarii TaxID=254406 RepID=UPI001FB36DBC|nr:hypothetical protein [Shimia aestuarii]
MLGVVLWSDSTDKKAVIWCEDHGELAYFDGAGSSIFDGATLDAGDLVQFEMQQDNQRRLARNMRRLQQGAYEGLTERLVDASAPKAEPEPQEQRSAGFSAANIIPFTRRRNARRAGEFLPA